jgi:type IV secretory pathway VirB4 component
MTRLQIFARRREAIPENKRVPFFLIVDEAQNFLSKETARTLDQFGRKFGLFMILANQHIRQIEDTQLKGSILANCKNKIVGMSDKATRQALAGEMGLDYTDFEDLKTGTFFGKFNSIEPLKFYSPLTRDLDLGINKRFAYSQNSGEWVDGWEKAGMKKTIMGNTETGKTDKIKPKYDL